MTRRIAPTVVHEWSRRGLRLRDGEAQTLDACSDTNSFSLLVRGAVEALRPKAVLDVGCGCGIPTVEAARHGAERVVGIDIVPANVALARQNARCAGVAEQVVVEHVAWEQVLSGEYRVDDVQLVAANPPYVPDAEGVAVNGGPDGTRLVTSIIDGAARSASGLALLFGSLSNPLQVLTRLSEAGWSVQRVLAHAVPFGQYTSRAPTLERLKSLRRRSTAFFCDVSEEELAASDEGRAPHAYLVLGVVATRGRSPRGLLRGMERLLRDFQRGGRNVLDGMRLPVPLEAATYF